MPTKEEVAGSGLAGHAVADAAIGMLVKLGHEDVLKEMHETALATLERSVSNATMVDRTKTLAHGKQMMSALIQTSVVNAKFNASRQTDQRQ